MRHVNNYTSHGGNREQSNQCLSRLTISRSVVVLCCVELLVAVLLLDLNAPCAVGLSIGSETKRV